MKLQFLGAAGTVTGSCYYIEHGHVRLLVDCGLFQGGAELEQLNAAPFPFDPGSLAGVILTHAHIDHSGRLPLLYKRGFQGEIVTTKATADLARIMLADSAHVQAMEAAWESKRRQRTGRPAVQPLYDAADAAGVCQLMRGVFYSEWADIAPGVRVRFHDAGHILGSAMAELEIGDRVLLFSGDIGPGRRPVLRAPAKPPQCDYLILESTYGGRLHAAPEADVNALADVIRAVARDGGNLVIPAFAVGRAQELLYYLNKLYEAQQVPPIPVFLDSPLAQEATTIFGRHPECFDAETQALLRRGDDPFHFRGLQWTATAAESMALNTRRGSAIIISAAGMAQAGRVRHHLKHNLWRPESAVLFVGHQAQGTLGHALVNGARNVRLFGEDIRVKAKIVNLHGFSAHADQAGLLAWASQLPRPPREIYLTHGEPEAASALAAGLREQFGPGMVIHVPGLGDTVSLNGPGAPLQSAGRRDVALDHWLAWQAELEAMLETASSLLVDLETGRTGHAAQRLSRDHQLVADLRNLRLRLQGAAPAE